MFKGFDRNEIKLFTDCVKKYNGKLSYFRMYLLLYCASMFGKNFPDEAISYCEAVMASEIKKEREQE